jgi:tetratricopeptide (TPR) repeat protein
MTMKSDSARSIKNRLIGSSSTGELQHNRLKKLKGSNMGIIEKILKKPVRDPESTYLGGEALCKQGYYLDAISMLEPLISTGPGHARASLLKGFALYQLGSFEEALQFFDQALGIDPGLPDAHLYKGLIYSNFGKYTMALSHYDRALAIHPTFIQAWYVKGLTLSIQEKYEESVRAYERVLSLDPKHGDALAGITASMRKCERGRQEKTLPIPVTGIPEGGCGTVLPAITTVPVPCSPLPSPGSLPLKLPPRGSTGTLDPQADGLVYDGIKTRMMMAGLASSDPGDVLPIIPTNREAVDLPAPYGENSQEVQGENPFLQQPSASRCSSYEEMIREIGGAPANIPDPEQMYTLGDLYMKTGRYRDATGIFERILETGSENAGTWRSLGDARKKTGNYDEAKFAYDRSLEIEPGNPGVWLVRAKVLFMLNQHEEAIVSCDRAIALDTDFVDGWLYKGFILKKIQRNSDAIAVYDRVLALNPGHAHAARQLRSIRQSI